MILILDFELDIMKICPRINNKAATSNHPDRQTDRRDGTYCHTAFEDGNVSFCSTFELDKFVTKLCSRPLKFYQYSTATDLN